MPWEPSLKTKGRQKTKWRKWNNIIHRDLGYLCVGLTMIYAISGIAVNHIADWNPNYRLERLTSSINPAPLNGLPYQQLVAAILAAVGENRPLVDSFSPQPGQIQLFIKGNTISVNLKTGAVVQEKSMPRKGLQQMNFLHLNHAKKLWTWFADLYALALFFLALTGMFVLRGKKGITGRGAWLTGAGVGLPLFFLWLYM